MTTKEIQDLAKRHGLLLTANIKLNDMGIDFAVGFAADESGNPWVLRIPRRTDMAEQIAAEKRILDVVSGHLSVEVPDWKISNEELVAYPLLQGKPVLTFDAKTFKVTWNMDVNNPNYVPTLAKILVNLHNLPEEEVRRTGSKQFSASDSRNEIKERLHLVKSELGISTELERRYLRWLDSDKLWPSFTKFIHGDLYAGHILTNSKGEVSGIIDWTTAHVNDIALDFSGHVSIFGEESVRVLIQAYESEGGETWNYLFEQAVERAAAAPLAYGFFAIDTDSDEHKAAAKLQLGVT